MDEIVGFEGFDDIEIDLTGDNARWEEFVTKIMEGNVIPVIGPDLQLTGERNVEKYLIKWFARKFNVNSNPETFSQLVYDTSFPGDKEKIYNIIDQVLNQMPLPPSDLLKQLFETRKFPFVITTSFTPVVENAMKAVWGDGVRVLQFRNDPSRDMKGGVGDILSEADMKVPTVFYMFGKYSIERHRYAVTDIDFMEFCKSWLAEQHVPKTLTTAIKKRTLFVLGSSYSDWLLRFIWYSMRSRVEDLRSSLVVGQSMDPSLEKFLMRLETFIQKEPHKTIDELTMRIRNRASQVAQERKEIPRFFNDVFISYSRTDEEVVGKLMDSLKSEGLKVWYDRDNIEGSDDWRQKITQGIRSSRLFVPILSTNIEREIYEEHEYRMEWRTAASISNKRGGQAFIFPLAEKGFDFYRQETKIPAEFQEKHAIGYDAASDFKAIAESIRKKVDELKELEKELGYGNN